MGLSISSSNAQRIRIEELSAKKAKSGQNSSVISPNKANQSQLRDKIEAELASVPEKKVQQKTKQIERQKQIKDENILKKKDVKYAPNQKDLQKYKQDSSSEVPKSTVSKVFYQDIPQQYQQIKINRSEQVINQQSSNPTKLIKKQNFPSEQKKSKFSNNMNNNSNSNKHFSQKKNHNNQDFENIEQENDNKIRKNESKTLHMMKIKPFTSERTGHIYKESQINNMDVQFEKFDWQIPKSNDKDTIEVKTLKNESVISLISKCQNEKQKKLENKSKVNWKNRRQLMNQIANDRLETADEPFSFNRCLPSKDQEFKISNRICS